MLAIEERVKERSQRNVERIRAGNAIPTTRVFDRDSIVSLLIPSEYRLLGEVRRVFCRVVQHTRGGYQLTTKWGLLTGRFQHIELNRVDHDIGVDEIPKLTVQEAKKAKKLALPAMAAYMNSRGAISGMQRKGRKKL